MILANGTVAAIFEGGAPPKIGDRITDKLAHPHDEVVRDWVGQEAFEHWVELRNWIDALYPSVFQPDWLYGGRKRGWVLRYKKTRSFCTFLPQYKLFSVLVVLGTAERERFEERRYRWTHHLVELYDEARTYPDGKWLEVPIVSIDDRHEVKNLLTMKRPPRFGYVRRK